MSVDETATPTTVAEHFFVANELKRRGVHVHSLALRFVGEFQKGIDYKGDLAEFEARLREHVVIARHLGPYKISIHSGSDKFSIFPIAARVCGELVHEKTAGTWYLEALRVAARVQPSAFPRNPRFRRRTLRGRPRNLSCRRRFESAARLQKPAGQPIGIGAR